MMRSPFRIIVAALALSTAMPSIAHAQTALDGRVDRLEREMKAVQRKVFPGGAGQVVAPDAAPAPSGPPPGSPIAGPVTNLEQRVTTLESNFAAQTNQVELLQNQLRQVTDAFNAYKRTTDARLKAIEDTLTTAGGAGAPAGAGVSGGGAVVKPGPDAPKPVGGKPAPDAPKPAPDTKRADLVAAVEKPSTNNPAEDQYLYGYRLWAAKLYPEARTQLAGVVTKYPKDKRASYAQNLLGRAYLDEGKYQDAAKAFYENYVKMPQGDRAADSLYFLSVTLQKLKAAPAEVCKVYAAIDSEYAGKMSLEQQADIDRGKTAAKCK